MKRTASFLVLLPLIAACGGSSDDRAFDVTESDDALIGDSKEGNDPPPVSKPGETAPRPNLQMTLTNDASSYCASDWIGFRVTNTGNASSPGYWIGAEHSAAEKLGNFPGLAPGQSYNGWFYYPGHGAVLIFAAGTFAESNPYDNQATAYCP